LFLKAGGRKICRRPKLEEEKGLFSGFCEDTANAVGVKSNH